jgi:hypothetical protein
LIDREAIFRAGDLAEVVGEALEGVAEVFGAVAVSEDERNCNSIHLPFSSFPFSIDWMADGRL